MSSNLTHGTIEELQKEYMNKHFEMKNLRHEKQIFDMYMENIQGQINEKISKELFKQWKDIPFKINSSVPFQSLDENGKPVIQLTCSPEAAEQRQKMLKFLGVSYLRNIGSHYFMLPHTKDCVFIWLSLDEMKYHMSAADESQFPEFCENLGKIHDIEQFSAVCAMMTQCEGTPNWYRARIWRDGRVEGNVSGGADLWHLEEVAGPV